MTTRSIPNGHGGHILIETDRSPSPCKKCGLPVTLRCGYCKACRIEKYGKASQRKSPERELMDILREHQES